MIQGQYSFAFLGFILLSTLSVILAFFCLPGEGRDPDNFCVPVPVFTRINSGRDPVLVSESIFYLFSHAPVLIHSIFCPPYFSLKDASALEDSGTFSLKMMAGMVVKEKKKFTPVVACGDNDDPAVEGYLN